MRVYDSTKDGFSADVKNGVIAERIYEAVKEKLGHGTAANEQMAWQESMRYMQDVLNDDEIPGDAGVSIEYSIPPTGKRIDFIVTGANEDESQENAVIVELKQWEKAEKTAKDGIVKTFINKSDTNTTHPSYQAYSYKQVLLDFNEMVRNENIGLHACAYLHNYDPKNKDLCDPFYEEYIKEAPLFLKTDGANLTKYIKKYIKVGDKKHLMYRIENGKLKPSKALADYVASLIHGNKEYTMIDEQKVVFEDVLEVCRNPKKDGKKQVFIIEGGPGTGKSVVAVNLLAEMIKSEEMAAYVTKNNAPREVYKTKLSGCFPKKRIEDLFIGSGRFTDQEKSKDRYKCLIVDEAHRLTEQDRMKRGENQVKEIINAAEISVFFIDENQKIQLIDFGTTDEIKKQSKLAGAELHYIKLNSQFRCNGSDGYLEFLDDLLDIKKADAPIDIVDFDVQVFDTPTKLHEKIEDLNRKEETWNKARVVAGYCWRWVTRTTPKNGTPPAFDIEIGSYKKKWNLHYKKEKIQWIIRDESIDEIGSIHTCQGLELDYVGVIIGDDLIARKDENGKYRILTDRSKNKDTDSSFNNYKRFIKDNGLDEDEFKKVSDKIIKNTYRVLLTRGMKGCYIYCTDKETREYFKERVFKVNRRLHKM